MYIEQRTFYDPPFLKRFFVQSHMPAVLQLNIFEKLIYSYSIPERWTKMYNITNLPPNFPNGLQEIRKSSIIANFIVACDELMN